MAASLCVHMLCNVLAWDMADCLMRYWRLPRGTMHLVYSVGMLPGLLAILKCLTCSSGRPNECRDKPSLPRLPPSKPLATHHSWPYRYFSFLYSSVSQSLFLARELLLASKNNNGSSHPCSSSVWINRTQK